MSLTFALPPNQGAGANTTTNRTAWPLAGGAIELELHHAWSYVWVNLGLGSNTTNYNISLTPDLYNISGKGDFCWPKLPVPVEITDGTNATIQVVTGGASGSALYNVSALPPANGLWRRCLANAADSAPISPFALMRQPTSARTARSSTSPSFATGRLSWAVPTRARHRQLPRQPSLLLVPTLVSA